MKLRRSTAGPRSDRKTPPSLAKARREAGLCPASGKQRYRDHKQAVDALHQIAGLRKQARDNGRESRRREVRSYHCTACHGWHLTSQPATMPAGQGADAA